MPAATVSHQHTCPVNDPGPKPHVGGIISQGSPNVLICGQSAARVGDPLVCQGPPDTINKGSTNVKINGLGAARQNDLTAHGGVIVQGVATVLIGG
ncbi:PAAR domain-containing protein [Zooshikella marina]|nr:PAAR domain-containing protein [Zooshikella ganghwensis]